MPDTTRHMSISLDGFVAGPDQSREHPLGKRGRELHGWHLGDERANEADETAVGWLMRPRGAYVMGRNMFGPIRGEWEEDWRGWWGSCARGGLAAGPKMFAGRPAGKGGGPGGGGGGPGRRTTHRCSCSPITPTSRSRWRAARPSTSSPTASTPPTHRRVRRPAT